MPDLKKSDGPGNPINFVPELSFEPHVDFYAEKHI